MRLNKRICWVTATYFLDVDVPVVPLLKKTFDIDWFIVTNQKNYESDRDYIRTQSNCSFHLIESKGHFFSIQYYRFLKDFILRIEAGKYDWYYFDISDFIFLFPLINKHLPKDRITIATHNVSVPKGARYAPLAKISMRYILHNFDKFHVFSKNQASVLFKRCPSADVFYCPLMLKDYGMHPEIEKTEKTRFLFFGNIVRYKRVDLLLTAINLLVDRGVTDFSVTICGDCSEKTWNRIYKPLIKHPEYVECEIRRIPNDRVSFYFNSNDYFIMPYQDIAQSGAMTVALNYRMPILASDLPTFHEFIDDGITGFFFQPGNSESLANVMFNAMQLPRQEFNKIRLNIQQMVEEKLSTQKIIDQYVKYLNSKLQCQL